MLLLTLGRVLFARRFGVVMIFDRILYALLITRYESLVVTLVAQKDGGAQTSARRYDD